MTTTYRGKFGQLPTPSSSIASTIISLAREMQTANDTAIMDAWKNGGTFQGKPVTDDDVINYWKQRLTQVSKDDPNYTVYSNTIMQTEYSIAESKATTIYDQSPPSAAADTKLAKFYIGWESKIPKDSEFYRVLQRDAAQFVQAAAAKNAAAGRAGAASAKAAAKAAQEAAYAKAQAATIAKYEAPGQYLTDTLVNVARANGLIGEDPNADLSNFNPSDPTTMQRLIAGVNSNPDAVLYHDPSTGQPITGAMVLAKLKTLDPHFSGTLSSSYYARTQQQQLTGEQIRLQRANSSTPLMAVHKTDADNIAKWVTYTTENGREANAWPIETHYQIIRGQFLQTWDSPTATPQMKLAAWNTYRGGLLQLADSTSHPPDDNTKSRLIAEANGDGSVDNLSENFTGLSAGDHSTTGGVEKGDTAQTQLDVQQFTVERDSVASGNYVWAMGTRDANGVFTPGGTNANAVGATTITAAQASSPSGAALMYIDQGNGQPPIPVFVPGKAITATVVDANGNSITATHPTQSTVGIAYDVVENGQTVRLYAIPGPNGHPVYTTEAPWANSGNIQSHDVGGVVQLTVRLGGVATPDNVKGNGAFTVNVPAQTAAEAAAGTPSTKPTTITVNPATLVLNSDPIRSKAGLDPSTDSYSPTVALHLTTPAGLQTLADIQHDPTANAVISYDLHTGAGMTMDQFGMWRGDAASYGIYTIAAQNTQIAQNQQAVGRSLLGVIQGFTRGIATATWGAPSAPTPTALTGAMSTGGIPANSNQAPAGSLPADQAIGTGFDGLGRVFIPGTTQIAPTSVVRPGTAIKTGASLTLPNVPDTTGGHANPPDLALQARPAALPPVVAHPAVAPTAAPTPPTPTPVTPTPEPTTTGAPPPTGTPPGPTDSAAALGLPPPPAPAGGIPKPPKAF